MGSLGVGGGGLGTGKGQEAECTRETVNDELSEEEEGEGGRDTRV